MMPLKIKQLIENERTDILLFIEMFTVSSSLRKKKERNYYNHHNPYAFILHHYHALFKISLWAIVKSLTSGSANKRPLKTQF